jgi:hypothetical protein
MGNKIDECLKVGDNHFGVKVELLELPGKLQEEVKGRNIYPQHRHQKIETNRFTVGVNCCGTMYRWDLGTWVWDLASLGRTRGWREDFPLPEMISKKKITTTMICCVSCAYIQLVYLKSSSRRFPGVFGRHNGMLSAFTSHSVQASGREEFEPKSTLQDATSVSENKVLFSSPQLHSNTILFSSQQNIQKPATAISSLEIALFGLYFSFSRLRLDQQKTRTCITIGQPRSQVPRTHSFRPRCPYLTVRPLSCPGACMACAGGSVKSYRLFSNK